MNDGPIKMNNRRLRTVKIRGVAFRALIGSRKEQILQQLAAEDDRGDVSVWLIIGATGVVFWGVGILTAWWII